MKKYLFIICLLVTPLMAYSQCEFAFGEWDAGLTPMPTARSSFSVVTYHDSIYVLGGFHHLASPENIDSVDVYVPSSDTWITGVTEFPFARGCPNACLVGDKIYAFGGSHITDGGDNFTAFDSLHIYDIPSNTWSAGKNLPVKMSYFGADTLGGKIYVVGGGGTGWTITNTLYVYDPGLDEWTEKATLNRSRWGTAARSYMGKLYVFGGYAGSSWSVTRSIEVYDPTTDQWTDLTFAETPRTSLVMFLQDGQLFAMGGYSSSSSYQTPVISRYDIATDTWLDFFNPGDDMPAGRRLAACTKVGDQLFVLGGGASDIMDNIWAYTVKSLQQVKLFEDVTLGYESADIDLSEFFSTREGGSLSYSICEGYDGEVVAASLSNSTLTLDKSTAESGTTELIINAYNGTDTISSNAFLVSLPEASEIKTHGIHRFAVYPNPASDEVFINFTMEEAGAVSIEVFNTLGQKVEEHIVNSATVGFNTHEWNVALYRDGLYFVVLNTGTAQSLSTLIIKH